MICHRAASSAHIALRYTVNTRDDPSRNWMFFISISGEKLTPNERTMMGVSNDRTPINVKTFVATP